MLEPISPVNSREAEAFLAEHPHENVFLQWLIARRLPVRSDRNAYVLSRNTAGTVDGVCYFGRQCVPAIQGVTAFQAFADFAHEMPHAHMIVGQREQILRWWELLRPWYRVPRAVRERQPLYVIDRTTLHRSPENIDVGPATLDELDEITRESAAMIEHEIGIRPNPNNLEFRERNIRLIRAGWWWRWRVEGVLRFQCNIGAVSSYTAQLQGVWTPPAQRRRGYARIALSAICDRLLEQFPTLSLYVNDFNTPAIALYERSGFQHVNDFMTLLF